MPLGGVIIPEKIAKTFDERVFPGGLTYSGHPLACATAVATIDVMKSEKMVENAASIGEKILGPGLNELAKKHQVIVRVANDHHHARQEAQTQDHRRDHHQQFGLPSHTSPTSRNAMPHSSTVVLGSKVTP